MSKRYAAKIKRTIQKFKLSKQTELRFEVEANSKITVQLLSGTAEIFGTELVINKKYTFSKGEKIAVYTWHGCSLVLEGNPEVAYVAKETPMVYYANIHATLEQMRQKSEKDSSKGPTVLITGRSHAGKSTLCRILLSYAVRLGRRPIFVDLNVKSSSISVAGTLAAVPVERVIDIEEEFSSITATPLVFHYGHLNPSNNITLYNILVSRMAELISTQATENGIIRVSGLIINTCSWNRREGYQPIKHAAMAFQVDVILVIDQERLYNELVRDVPTDIKIVSVPKSGGVSERSPKTRTECQDSRIRHYFYGSRAQLYPHSLELKFCDVKIFRIGTPSWSDSCIPLGMKMEDNSTKLRLVSIGPKLLHHVLSVSFAENVEDVLMTNVAGFVCVTNVDMQREFIRVLSPRSWLLPKVILLMSEVQFVDAL